MGVEPSFMEAIHLHMAQRVYYGYSDKVFDYLITYFQWKVSFRIKTFVESEKRFFTYPIHENDIPEMSESKKIKEQLDNRDNSKEPNDFEEYWVNRVEKTLRYVRKYIFKENVDD